MSVTQSPSCQPARLGSWHLPLETWPEAQGLGPQPPHGTPGLSGLFSAAVDESSESSVTKAHVQTSCDGSDVLILGVIGVRRVQKLSSGRGTWGVSRAVSSAVPPPAPPPWLLSPCPLPTPPGLVLQHRPGLRCHSPSFTFLPLESRHLRARCHRHLPEPPPPHPPFCQTPGPSRLFPLATPPLTPCFWVHSWGLGAGLPASGPPRDGPFEPLLPSVSLVTLAPPPHGTCLPMTLSSHSSAPSISLRVAAWAAPIPKHLPASQVTAPGLPALPGSEPLAAVVPAPWRPGSEEVGSSSVLSRPGLPSPSHCPDAACPDGLLSRVSSTLGPFCHLPPVTWMTHRGLAVSVLLPPSPSGVA